MKLSKKTDEVAKLQMTILVSQQHEGPLPQKMKTMALALAIHVVLVIKQ